MPIRILNLEDDEVDSALVERELRKTGLDFELVRVAGREEFARHLRDATPDLVISDHSLPGVTGLDALELTRRACPGVPFILVTGSLDEESAVRYMKGGAADYVLKDRVIRLGPAVSEALERARERASLRRYQELLDHIINANPNLIFVRDAGGAYLLVNQALATAFGTTVDALVGKTDAELGSPEELLTSFRTDHEVLESGRPALIAEQALTSATTGATRWYQTNKVPIRLAGDPSPKVLGVATDITERKRLEDQLRQAQKMEAVGQLAGGIAHDFNNVLTAVLGHAELLLTNRETPSRMRPDLDEIRRAAEHAAALTRQLLAFGRRQILQPRNLQLNELIREVERMLRRLLAENIEIELRLAARLGTIRADPNQLSQVLVNLAVNARDAMPNGGRLVIETVNLTFDQIFAHAHLGVTPGRYVGLIVTDTGVGMDEETRARLFEPFFTTKKQGQGTGLGLSTVYGIVRQSGGSIFVDTALERGTTFKVYLPRIDAPPEEQQARSAEGGVGGDETILLAEDSVQVRALAAHVLRMAGYTVLEAPNGAEAERIAAEYPDTIHLLFTDLIMPGISGRELARRLQARRPELRVLFASGYTDDSILKEGDFARGTFLQKPFSVRDLRAHVRRVLDRVAAPSLDS